MQASSLVGARIVSQVSSGPLLLLPFSWPIYIYITSQYFFGAISSLQSFRASVEGHLSAAISNQVLMLDGSGDLFEAAEGSE